MSEQPGHAIRLTAPDDSGEFPLPESGARAVTLSEYDALADLFLAGAGSLSTPTERARGGTSTPTTRETQSPASIPSPAAVPSPPISRSVPRPASPSQRRVEAIIVGHLPVLAAVWVGQYARRLAETLGLPVALLRLHAGQCSLEVTGDLSSRAQAELITHAASNPPIERAIEIASAHAAAWLLRTDEPEEIALAEHAGVTDITLLTGADDMALVATYRTLKALATGASGPSDPSEGESGPNLRIAILGATPEKAAVAEAKLARTASAYLGRPVTILNAGQRIGSSPSVMLHRANAAVPTSHILECISRASPASSAPSGEPSPSRAAESCSRIGPARFDPSPALVEPKSPPTPPAPKTPRDLPSLFEGMRPLPTRCPYAPGVQFGLDPKGRLHLFAMPDTDATIREVKPAAMPESTPRSESLAPAQTLAQLVAASGWAFDHLDLLRLASPGYTITNDASDITLHLLTSEPKSVRRLLDSGVLVHAVLPATVGETTTWVVRDLN